MELKTVGDHIEIPEKDGNQQDEADDETEPVQLSVPSQHLTV